VNNRKAVTLVAAVSLLAMLSCAFLLTAVFGPVNDGFRCARFAGRAQCEVRQTRFFGLYRNSTFTIPESSIRGAKAACGQQHAGGRPSPNCLVYLALDSGREYPVSSYVFGGRAYAAARKLNDYFDDKSAGSIALTDDVWTPALIAIGTVAFMSAIAALRWWRVRNGRPSQPPRPA